MHVEVNPEILRWACERAGLNTMIVAERVPQLTAWERGEKHPTLKQLEKFAKRVHAPLGYFFLQRHRKKNCRSRISAQPEITIRRNRQESASDLHVHSL
jgi:transcriptional regulator with XRE-family HTH domain